MSHFPKIPSRRRRLKFWVGPLALVLLGAFLSANEAQAQNPGIQGFQPFGFYQPYGIQYRSSVATPPYFSVNPPVYYGTRHYRPYGISPFATPPQVTAPPNYHGRPGSSGLRSRTYTGPVGNPFICQSGNTSNNTPSLAKGAKVTQERLAFEPGKVQTNPFVESERYLARR